jgi:hypothetical protein
MPSTLQTSAPALFYLLLPSDSCFVLRAAGSFPWRLKGMQTRVKNGSSRG